jgi:hypothetical protein
MFSNTESKKNTTRRLKGGAVAPRPKNWVKPAAPKISDTSDLARGKKKALDARKGSAATVVVPPPVPIAAPVKTKISMPLDSSKRYEEIWKMCENIVKQLKDSKDPNDPIIILKEGSTYKVSSNPELKLNKLALVQYLNIMRYNKILRNLVSKEPPPNAVDFFNELESNREYHARACITLCSIDDSKIKEDTLKDINISDLDEIDRIVFEENNTSKAFGPYELTFLVTPLMVVLAQYELDGPLEKKTYFDAIVNVEESKTLPSHLRILSRIPSLTKEKAKELYPQSLLMNYSMFYPFVLYPTGEAPPPAVPVTTAAPAAAAAAAAPEPAAAAAPPAAPETAAAAAPSAAPQ